jgi:preprotein translocase subunit YajC
MHHFLNLLAQTTPPTTTHSKKSSGSSYLPLLIIIVIFAGIWMLFIRPRQQRMRQQQQATRQIGIGDQVISAGGIYGTVVAIDSDVVEVEVAPGVVMTFLRRAVSPRAGAAAGPSSRPVEDRWDVPSQAAGDYSSSSSGDAPDASDGGGDEADGPKPNPKS